jgi:hypothetical protein
MNLVEYPSCRFKGECWCGGSIITGPASPLTYTYDCTYVSYLSLLLLLLGVLVTVQGFSFLLVSSDRGF